MISHIFSIQGLAFVLPFLLVSLIFCAAQYGHLHFKHVDIKKVSLVCAFVSLPVAIFLLPLVIKLAFDVQIRLLSIHGLLTAMCFIAVFALYVFKPKRLPNLVQIMGVGVFAMGFYYLLA